MNVQTEISLYPLRTAELGEAINRFLGNLEDAGLTVDQGSMGSTLAGDCDAVFSAVGAAFRTVADDSQVVLVMKISNACPAMRGRSSNSSDR